MTALFMLRMVLLPSGLLHLKKMAFHSMCPAIEESKDFSQILPVASRPLVTYAYR